MENSEDLCRHSFEFVFKFGTISYWECADCGDRKYELSADSSSPIDWNWLNRED